MFELYGEVYSPGGRGGRLGVRTAPPFGSPPNFRERGKTSRASTRMRYILVLTVTQTSPTPFEIMYPPLYTIGALDP